MTVSNELHADIERTIPRFAVPPVLEPKPAAQAQEATGTSLKLFGCGLERDERQLLEGLVRVSLRRSPRLQLLDEKQAAQADVVLVGTGDNTAVAWAERQGWMADKAVIWIGSRTRVAPGHTVIKRPVQWSILPSLLAKALEHGPGSVHASRPTPLASGHVPLPSSQMPLTGGAAPLGVSPRTGSSPILVVDDSLAIRNHLCSLLEAGGFAVSLADSVESALKMLEQRRFDCVLMDVLMPGVDGYEGCRQIKSNLRGDQTIPVVMLTSKSSPFDRIRGKMAGCDAYLTKPVDPQQLGEVLAQHLHN
jgi:twitching motility two-component system response regulator PilG